MKIFIAAGEVSGDILGAQLIEEIKRRHPLCEIIGVGGPKMLEAGLSKSVFPMEDLAVIGLFEILPKLGLFLRYLFKTKQFILSEKPDLIITIDASAFYLRLLKALRKKMSIPTIHYNAPAVWASRPGRAKEMASYVDHLLCLYPFEPPYFTVHGMQATFIGHPLCSREGDSSNISDINGNPPPVFEKKRTNVTVLFGSRAQEIEKLADPFIHACVLLQKDVPDLHVLVPTFERYKKQLKAKLDASSLAYEFVEAKDKEKAFNLSKAALAASGTVALELARAEVPFVIGYKLSPLTYFFAKRLVITPYVCLVNVLLKAPIIEECLQEKCTPEVLYQAMKKLIFLSPKDHKILLDKLRESYHMLCLKGKNPTHTACDIIDKVMCDGVLPRREEEEKY